MPVRLIVILLAVLAGFLFTTFQNPEAKPFTIYQGLTLDLPISVPMMVSFFAGAVSVFALYFYDTIAWALGGFKESSERKRKERIKRLYEAGAERLLMDHRPEAEKLFRKTLAHDPDNVAALVALGKMRREEGAVSEAIKLHSKAKGIDGRNLSALLELSEDYAAAEQFGNAVSILNETRSLTGRSIPPLERIRNIYMGVRNWKEAQATQKKIVELSKGDKIYKERRTMAAFIYESALDDIADGRPADARDGLRSTIKLDNQFVPAYLKLAEVEERLGWKKETVTILEKGFKATKSIIIIKALETLLLARGEQAQAVAELKWAKNISPQEDVIRLFLAMAYIRADDYASASQEMEPLNGRLESMTLYHLVEGKIRQNENNLDMALSSLENALSQEMATFFHFSCSSCNQLGKDFSGRCPACGEWNSLNAVLF